MDRAPKQWIALALASLWIHASCVVVHAQTGGLTAGFEAQLKELQRSLDEAELANATVRTTLNEVRDTFYDDNWLDDERAASVMSLVQDVLADSDHRVNLFGDGTMMGWSDGFHLSSADGQFRLKIGGLIQSQVIARWNGVDASGGSVNYDQWRYGAGMSRTELSFSGHAFGRGLKYHLELGWGRYDPYNITNQGFLMSPRLWDAWIAFKLNSEVEIKIGQFSLPFSKEGLIKSPYQLAVFPTLIEYFMGLQQSQGIEVDWETDNRRFAIALTNGSPALFQVALWGNTDPTPPWTALGSDTLYSVTMRHEWKLLGDWEQFDQFTSPPGSERGIVIGLAGHRQNTESNTPIPVGGWPDGQLWGVNADIMMQFDGASLFGAVIYERLRDFSPILPRVNLLAFVAQASTYITNQTELFARWEGGGPDRELVGGDHLQILTLGFNHYIDGQDVKVTADLGFSFGEISAALSNPQAGWLTDSRRRNQMLLRTQLQLMF